MPPSYRRRLLRELAVALLLAALGFYALFARFHPVAVGVIFVCAAFCFVALVHQFVRSRCPRCQARIDLRGGQEIHCPYCGVRIPTKAELDRLEEEEEHTPGVHTDTYVDFTSSLGNTFTAPSLFTAEDKSKNFFTLTSPDGLVQIHAITVVAQSMGTLEAFREMMIEDVRPKWVKAWKASDWSIVTLRGGHEAQKRELVPVQDSDRLWRLYVVDGGELYHAIVLSARDDIMTLNGGFYENIVRTFDCARRQSPSRT